MLDFQRASVALERRMFDEPIFEQPIFEPIFEQPIFEPIFGQPIFEPLFEQPIFEPRLFASGARRHPCEGAGR